MANIEREIGLQIPLEDVEEVKDEVETETRRHKQELLDKIYGFFPELGPLLNEALTAEDSKKAESSLVEINNKYYKNSNGTYTIIDWHNPKNGRKFTLKVYDTGGKFQKDSASRYSVVVTWQTDDFKK